MSRFLKSISLIGAGAVLGGGAMWLISVMPDSDSPASGDPPSLLRTVSDFALGRRQDLSRDTITVEQRLAVYREVATTTDLVDLRADLEQLALQPFSAARDIEIDAVLTRMSDLQPGTAATLARSSGLDTRFVAAAYVDWAGVDPGGAIDGLKEITNRDQRRHVALALLDVLGEDLNGIDRVARGLPASERDSLTVEWIVSRAEVEPLAAFRDAQQLEPPSVRRMALERVGAAWAAQDPRGALAQAGMLPDDQQSAYRSGVFAEWSRLDGDDFVAWLATTPSPPIEVVAGIGRVARSRPETILGIAAGMDGDIGRSMRASALIALAESDPAAAMARAAAAPPGSDRELMLMAVGSVIARDDPDAAMAWAESLGSPQSLVIQITQSLVESNLDRAIEIMSDPPAGVDPQFIALRIASTVARESDRAEAFANQLLADDSLRSADTLRNLIGNWMQQDPERAAAWVFAHESGLNADIIGPAAQAMAMADPEAAASYVNRVPTEYRSAWINQVAGRYGGHDLNGALAWVSQFQGQEVYASALRQIVAAAAQIDPRAAADILSRSSTEVQRGAATQVAQALARGDPRSAARWAQGLSDGGVRQEAVAAAIATWAASDAGAARNYTLGLDRGEDRDRALHSLVLQLSQRGDFDRSLLDAYSSDRAQQEALARAIPMVARNNLEEAEDLLELVTSSNARAGLETQLETINARR